MSSHACQALDATQPTTVGGGAAIFGSGEMASRIRAFRWEDGPLGPITSWSETLLATVNTMLAAPISIQLLWGPEMIILYNDAFIAGIGGKHPSALGQEARVCWHEAWSVVGEQLLAAWERGESTHLRAVPIPLSLNGTVEEVYWNYAYSPIFAPDGAIVGILDIAQNVTDTVLSDKRVKALEEARLAAEKATREGEERLRLALTAANGVGTWDWDVPNDCVYADRRFAEAYGVDPARADAGCPISDFLAGVHPEDREQASREIIEATQTGEEYAAEYRLLSASGNIRWTSVRGRCQIDADGHPIRFPGVMVDITERKDIEQALIRSEKLAAVGRLASSIAHEINNPLESVTNLLYLLRDIEDEQFRTYVETAERELRRVSAITSQTLRFHKQSTDAIPTLAQEAINSALTIYQGKLVNSGVVVQTRNRAQRPVICFDGEIRQVLSNLISNAIDAMPSGGRLLLRSREATDWTSGERGVAVTVADTGTGMPAETVRRAFEAFFTTKGIGGTGLGLWISKEIVERHRGRLSVRSREQPGCSGTVFSMFLPFDGQSSSTAI